MSDEMEKAASLWRLHLHGEVDGALWTNDEVAEFAQDQVDAKLETIAVMAESDGYFYLAGRIRERKGER